MTRPSSFQSPMLVAALVAGAAFVAPSTGRAASIDVDLADDGRAFIKVEGEIHSDDGPHFSDIAAKYAKAVVLLDSPGGSMLSGLQIGRVIHTKQFTTFSPEGAHCYSSCALMWLAGMPRVMQPGSVIGFHAAFNSRTHETSGVGNALIGSYFASLGVGDEAIMFLEEKNWSDVNVLTPKDAARLGIEVRVLPTSAEMAERKRAHAQEEQRQAAIDRPNPVEEPRREESSPPAIQLDAPRREAAITAVPNLPAPTAPTGADADAPEARSRRFVQEYFAHWSESNAEALGFFTAAYAPQVEFYGQRVEKDLLIDRKRDYAGRWPVRVYAARPASLSITCDAPRKTQCVVTGIVDWDCRSGPEGGTRSHGAAKFAMTLDMARDTQRIVKESGVVIDRAVD